MALMDDIEFEDDPAAPVTPLRPLANAGIVRRSPVGEDDTQLSGLNLLASVARTPGTRRLVRAGIQMNPRSPGLFQSPSVLRRRQREPENPSWSKKQKLHFSEFATHLCVEYDVPTAEKDDIITKSQLSTHELLITLYARLARDQVQASDLSGQAWLKSPQFKEYVIAKLYAILLDPNLSSYKTGLLSRCMHHICLHPNQYRIPKDIHDFVPSKAFATHLSRCLASCRAEIKRKLLIAWDKKKDIYAVVRSLIGTSGISVTDTMWGRWAWIQIKLVDYREAVKKLGKREKHFWDSIDNALEQRRTQYKDLAEPDRSKRVSRVFELTLQKHHKICPPKKRPASNESMPAWQREISNAIQEMEGYSDQDLTQVDVDDAEDDELNAAIEQEENPSAAGQ